jgi:hypothetical protein
MQYGGDFFNREKVARAGRAYGRVRAMVVTSSDTVCVCRRMRYGSTKRAVRCLSKTLISKSYSK